MQDINKGRNNAGNFIEKLGTCGQQVVNKWLSYLYYHMTNTFPSQPRQTTEEDNILWCVPLTKNTHHQN